MKRVTISVLLFFSLVNDIYSQIDTAEIQNTHSVFYHANPLCFIQLSSGCGYDKLKYRTSHKVQGLILEEEFSGQGYTIPTNLSLGIKISSLKAFLGVTIDMFKVPELKKGVPTDIDTLKTDMLKTQIKDHGTNVYIPFGLEYDVYSKKNFTISYSLRAGLFYASQPTYDGNYMQSYDRKTHGYMIALSIVPSYQVNDLVVFVKPAYQFSKIIYRNTTTDELFNQNVNLEVGVYYLFKNSK